MKRTVFLLVAVVALTCGVAATSSTSQPADEAAASIAAGKLPAHYRDWRLISVAREAGELNDIRAVLCNDVATNTYRDCKPPFPDGTIIARLAWSFDANEENNKTFGTNQSFTAGHPKNGV